MKKPQDQTHEEWWADYDAATAIKPQHLLENDMLRDKGGADFDPAPAGTHIGRCYQIIGLGTTDNEYQGVHNDVTKIFIGFELPNSMKTYEDKDKKEVTEPFSVGTFFTMSLSQKANLRHALVSWRGKEFTSDELDGFDEKVLLGVPCLLSIIHKAAKRAGAKPKAVITGWARLMEGQTCPEAFLTPVLFQVGDLNDWTDEAFQKVPKGFQNMFMNSYEYKERMNPGSQSSGIPTEQSENPAPGYDTVANDEFDDSQIPF